jgi:hypothetical protein
MSHFAVQKAVLLLSFGRQHIYSLGRALEVRPSPVFLCHLSLHSPIAFGDQPLTPPDARYRPLNPDFRPFIVLPVC